MEAFGQLAGIAVVFAAAIFVPAAYPMSKWRRTGAQPDIAPAR